LLPTLNIASVQTCGRGARGHISKGNGLVVCIAILIVFAVALLQGRHDRAMTRGQALLYGSIFSVAFVLVVPKAGMNEAFPERVREDFCLQAWRDFHDGFAVDILVLIGQLGIQWLAS
jgi:hypothetical protein